MASRPDLSAQMDSLVERLSRLDLPTDVTAGLEAAADKVNDVETSVQAVERLGVKQKARETQARLMGSGQAAHGGEGQSTTGALARGVLNGLLDRSRQSRLEDVKRDLAARLQAKRAERALQQMATTPPRYDEVYLRGVAMLSAAERRNATVVTIPIPKKYAGRFPDPVMYRRGHDPHLTLLFLGTEFTQGQLSQILYLLRQVASKIPPFRLYVDPNAGLKDFGHTEAGEKALWLPARSEPRGEAERLHRLMRLTLDREGVDLAENHDSFVPHVTWAYVPNDFSLEDRRRMDQIVSDRFRDGFYFDVRHIVLSLPDGSEKAIALSPIPRRM